VTLLEEPIAAAIGAGLPLEEPIGSMVVDIGGGTTEVAIMSLGGIVTCKSIRVGGDSMDESIINFIKKRYNLYIGESFAEQVKINLCSALIGDKNVRMNIQGMCSFTGLPKTISVTTKELAGALKSPLNAIIDAVKQTLEKAPPQLAADIVNNGIYLTGGGAQLDGIDRLINAETDITVHIADNPLDCVVNGTAKAVEHINEIEKMYKGDFM